MTGEVKVNVADGDDGVTMEFDNLAELAELLQLAGIAKAPDKIQTDDNGAFDVEVDDDGSISLPSQTDENADYDYGINPTSRKGYVYSADPYEYQGDAEIKTRYVPNRSGDNPLIRENKSFMAYLNEVEHSLQRKSRRAKKGR